MSEALEASRRRAEYLAAAANSARVTCQATIELVEQARRNLHVAQHLSGNPAAYGNLDMSKAVPELEKRVQELSALVTERQKTVHKLTIESAAANRIYEGIKSAMAVEQENVKRLAAELTAREENPQLTVSGLIAQLQAIMAERGDLPVVAASDACEGLECQDLAKEAQVVSREYWPSELELMKKAGVQAPNHFVVRIR